ncbi:hypothetical protein V7014_21015, partial [Bacillus sp. JJ722]
NVTKPVKEAPKANVTKPIAKEAPKPNVIKPIVKEAPKPNVVKPIVKEAPKPKPMPVPKAPVMKKKPKPVPVVPQPVIPEVDINNYYMVNMANMAVQKPAEKPKHKPKPVVPQQKPMSVVQENCVAVTPLMPGDGFCSAMYPMYHQFCEPIYGQMIQPLCGEESSLYESYPHMYPQYMPVTNQQMQPGYGAPTYQGYMSPVPEVSAHGLHHHIESSSHFGMGGHHHYQHESSSSDVYHHYHHESSSDHHHGHYSPMMPHQTNQFMMANKPHEESEEDCGCDQIQNKKGIGGQHTPQNPSNLMNQHHMPQQTYKPNQMTMPQQT